MSLPTWFDRDHSLDEIGTVLRNEQEHPGTQQSLFTARFVVCERDSATLFIDRFRFQGYTTESEITALLDQAATPPWSLAWIYDQQTDDYVLQTN